MGFPRDRNQDHRVQRVTRRAVAMSMQRDTPPRAHCDSRSPTPTPASQRNQTPQMLPASGPPLAWSCPAVSALLSGEDRAGRSRRLQRGQRNKERAVALPAASSPGPPGSSRVGAGTQGPLGGSHRDGIF